MLQRSVPGMRGRPGFPGGGLSGSTVVHRALAADLGSGTGGLGFAPDLQPMLSGARWRSG
jgi:hypothetical protein